jgi:hypothetical protein
VAFACGSKSMMRVFFSEAANEAPRLMAVVVLPTPPFWLAIEIMRAKVASPRYYAGTYQMGIRICKMFHVEHSGDAKNLLCINSSDGNCMTVPRETIRSSGRLIELTLPSFGMGAREQEPPSRAGNRNLRTPSPPSASRDLGGVFLPDPQDHLPVWLQGLGSPF